jgi:hypothetical protein
LRSGPIRGFGHFIHKAKVNVPVGTATAEQGNWYEVNELEEVEKGLDDQEATSG